MKKSLLLSVVVALGACAVNATSYTVFSLQDKGEWTGNGDELVMTKSIDGHTFKIDYKKAGSSSDLLNPTSSNYAWRVYKNSTVELTSDITMKTIVITYDDYSNQKYCVTMSLSDGWTGNLVDALYTLVNENGSTSITLTADQGQGRINSLVVSDEAGVVEPPVMPDGVIFEDAFDKNLDAWTKQNDTQLSDFNGWKINTNSPKCAICSPYYGGAAHAADSWLIKEFDLTNWTNVEMSFSQAFGFTLPTTQDEHYTVNVREVGGEWTALTMVNFPEKGSGNWSKWITNTFDLSEYDGTKIEIGFRYYFADPSDTAWELQNFKLSGENKSGAVEGVDVEDVNAAPVYYNLQGVRVENPSNGMYIMVKGDKATKVAL
ncbi:MAG: immune inhibitor A [Candidatus Amulumruptor caecigallinarius]|nr:immune inhibitor A [Candidatus Amulumruptor caecigallinarius]